jgi:hypothetical protein
MRDERCNRVCPAISSSDFFFLENKQLPAGIQSKLGPILRIRIEPWMDQIWICLLAAKKMSPNPKQAN